MTYQDKQVIEISIPSELGYEKVAMAAVATTAQKIGFSKDKIEDLKTAVGEACTNAIEHGNSFNVQTPVLIGLTVNGHSICVCVIDNGHKPIPDLPVDRSNRDDCRGLGLYLMQRLVDKLEIKCRPGRNEVQMCSYLTGIVKNKEAIGIAG